MNKGTYSLENDGDASFGKSAHVSGFTGNDVLAFTAKVFYGSNDGSGDGINVQKIKADILASSDEEVEKSKSCHDESTTGERFFSVIDKRRAEMKKEENEIELKQRLEENAEPNKVNDLISKLKRRFRDEKNARADALKPSYSQYSQYIFSNKVDAFLRYHEKPKVDIQYSQAPEDSQEDGLYTFAVRPSRIRKQKKSTIENIKEITNICTSKSQPNKVEAVPPESNDVEKAKGFGSTVSAKQNIDTSSDVSCYKDTEICNIKSVYTPAELPLMTKCSIPEILHNNEMSADDTYMPSAERVDNFLRTANNKMMLSADLLPSSSTLSSPTNQYFGEMNPIHNIQIWKKACYNASYLMPQYSCLKKNIPSFQEIHIGHSISTMFESKSLDRSVHNVISLFQKAIVNAGINVFVYEKGKWPPAKRKSYNSNANVTCFKMSLENEFHHSVRQICMIHEGSNGNRINQSMQMDTDTDYIMQSLKMLPLTRTKEFYGHSPTRNMLIVKGNKSFVTLAIPEISFNLRMFDSSSGRIDKLGGHLDQNICRKNYCLENRATLQELEMFAKFKPPVVQNFYKSVTLFLPDTTQQGVHHESGQVCKVSTVGNIYDNEEIDDGKCRKIHDVHETTTTTRDACATTTEESIDDESLFGIMNVYCNSEIHSRCGYFWEAA